MKRVYFAGKVSKGGGYRGKLLGNDRVMSLGYAQYDLTGGSLIYGGPFALGFAKGAWHDFGRHGLVDESSGHNPRGSFQIGGGREWESSGDQVEDNLDPAPDERSAVALCAAQICGAEAIHAYIDCADCHGTLWELGFASALGKPTYVYLNAYGLRHRLWFPLHAGNIVSCEEGTEYSIHPDLLTKPQTYKERYHEYLLSSEWNERRKAKIIEAGGRCQLCNAQDKLQVHHRTYDRVFNEPLEDLIALCGPCHEKFHDIVEK